MRRMRIRGRGFEDIGLGKLGEEGLGEGGGRGSRWGEEMVGTVMMTMVIVVWAKMHGYLVY